MVCQNQVRLLADYSHTHAVYSTYSVSHHVYSVEGHNEYVYSTTLSDHVIVVLYIDSDTADTHSMHYGLPVHLLSPMVEVLSEWKADVDLDASFHAGLIQFSTIYN